MTAEPVTEALHVVVQGRVVVSVVQLRVPDLAPGGGGVVVVGEGDGLGEDAVEEGEELVGDGEAEDEVGDGDPVPAVTVMVFLIAVVTGLVNGFGPPTYGAGIGVDGAAFEFVVAVAAVCALHAVTTSIPFDVAVKYTDSTLTSTDPEPDGVNESVFVNAGP